MTALTKYVVFKVWTPHLHAKWLPYRARRIAVPFVWILWAWRGLRSLARFPAVGRQVTVEELRAAHPKKRKCHCHGEGVLTTHRGGQAGVQFCAVMLAEFRKRYAWRTIDTKRGPHWRAGFAPGQGVDKRPS